MQTVLQSIFFFCILFDFLYYLIFISFHSTLFHHIFAEAAASAKIWYDYTMMWSFFKKDLILFHSTIILAQGFSEWDVECFKKYGKVYGTYDGIYPDLVVGDPDLLKRVLVKDFHNFPNHRVNNQR